MNMKLSLKPTLCVGGGGWVGGCVYMCVCTTLENQPHYLPRYATHPWMTVVTLRRQPDSSPSQVKFFEVFPSLSPIDFAFRNKQTKTVLLSSAWQSFNYLKTPLGHSGSDVTMDPQVVVVATIKALL